MFKPRTQLPSPAPSTAQSTTPAKPRRRWLRVVIALFAVLLLAGWFAPGIVAKTGLLNRFARQATADLNGTLDIGGASLGWFSAIELRDVSLTDSQGRVVARIPKVTSSKSLVGLLRDRSVLGEFTLDRPAFEVIVEGKTSNLEEVLRKYLNDDSPRGPTRPEVIVKVTGGTLILREAASGKIGEFTDLEALVSVPASRSDPVTAKVSANAPGKIEADIVAGESGRVKFAVSDFALESLAPLLRRFELDSSVAGSITADLTATWNKDTATIDGVLGAKNLALSGPWLNGDTLRLASVDLPLKAAMTGRAVRIERADLTSDIGNISVSGAFDPGEPLDKLLDRPGTKLDATIDLAKLAARLPKLLHVRDGTEIHEGKLVVKIESTTTANGTAWTGDVNTSALKALRDGREVRWDEPLSIGFVGRFKAGQLPAFDKLVCQSDFIAVNAQVSPDSVRAAANVHLDRLATRLADFVDLGGATLDGRGTATLVANRAPDGSFKAEGKVELTQFAFADSSGKGLREPQLKLEFSAAGKSSDREPAAVTAAAVSLTAGTDELHLKLLESIADVEQLSSGKLDARLTGNLDRWWSRVGSFVRIPKHYVLGGAAAASGTIRFGKDTIAIDRLTLDLKNARFRGAGLDLDEPQMNAVADLTVDLKAGTTVFENFTINSVPLAVTKGRLIIEAPDKGELVVEGGGPAVVGLARLGRTLKLFTDVRGPGSLHGRGTGSIKFRYSAGTTAFGGSLDIVNFTAGLPTDPDISEPSLRLEADGSYTESTETLVFKTAKIERPGLALNATTTFSKLNTTADVNLNGTLTYDLASLTPKLREQLGGNFTGQGKGSTPITISGRLAPDAKPGAKTPPGPLAALSAELRIGWDSLSAYGFDVGRGELRGKLTNGIAQVNPITATFGGGKVTVHPTVRLEPPPGDVTFAKGMIVERARLTPAVCASALGYALPAIANAGKAEGEISIKLEDNRIPFGDTNKANVKGQLLIHKATVSPGPVVSEIAKLLGADSVTMTLANETTVPIRVENGRVHHQNFTMKLGGYTVATSGSVGLDNTLDLIADVPIPSGLPGLKNSPLIAKALTGKRVQVPIKGTLAKPALDPKLFQAAVAKLVQDAAKDVGKELLNKELDKLFPGMPGPKK